MALKDVGALWLKSNDNGTFMSGTVELGGVKHRVFVFKNKHKKSDKHPDYKVSVSEEGDERPRPSASDEDTPF